MPRRTAGAGELMPPKPPLSLLCDAEAPVTAVCGAAFGVFLKDFLPKYSPRARGRVSTRQKRLGGLGKHAWNDPCLNLPWDIGR